MKKNRVITVQDIPVTVSQSEMEDYIYEINDCIENLPFMQT